MTGSKPEFKSISPFRLPTDAVDDYARERNIPSTVFPQNSKPVAVKAADPLKSLAKFSFDVSEDVAHRVKQRALDDRCTIRAIILKALSRYGIEVSPEDMIDDGRKRNRSAI